MPKKLNLKEVLKIGTPRQKALLLIQREEESNRLNGQTLTYSEQKAIIESVRKNPRESKELELYLKISERYIVNRFRFYGLQENLKKLSARIAGFCYIWELAERQAEYSNVLLGLVNTDGVKNAKQVAHGADVEKYIYQSCKSWNRYVPIRKKKDKEGKELREVEADFSQLRELIDGVVASYKASLGVAKAYYIASEEFVDKYNASVFVPEDIKEMLEYYKSPKTDVPEIFRRDSYLQLIQAKGEDDREVKYREKYAFFPAWEEIEPIGLNNAREALSI